MRPNERQVKNPIILSFLLCRKVSQDNLFHVSLTRPQVRHVSSLSEEALQSEERAFDTRFETSSELLLVPITLYYRMRESVYAHARAIITWRLLQRYTE